MIAAPCFLPANLRRFLRVFSYSLFLRVRFSLKNERLSSYILGRLLERDLFGGGESRFVINICGTHHSRDLSTCDLSLHIPHGSRDGTPLDSRPQNANDAKCFTSQSTALDWKSVNMNARWRPNVIRASANYGKPEASSKSFQQLSSVQLGVRTN